MQNKINSKSNLIFITLCIAALFVGAAVIHKAQNLEVIDANTLKTSASDDTKCQICYVCQIISRGVAVYTDNIYVIPETMNVVKNVKDAKERFEYFFDYGQGNFAYDKVHCGCSGITQEEADALIARRKLASHSRYVKYLDENNSYSPYSKQPSND